MFRGVGTLQECEYSGAALTPPLHGEIKIKKKRTIFCSLYVMGECELCECDGHLIEGVWEQFARIWTEVSGRALGLDLRILVAHTMTPIRRMPSRLLRQTYGHFEKNISCTSCCTMYMKHHYVWRSSSLRLLRLIPLLLTCGTVPQQLVSLLGGSAHIKIFVKCFFFL